MNQCPEGTFVDFQNRLLNGQDPADCKACHEILNTCKFQRENLNQWIELAENGDPLPFDVEIGPEEQDQDQEIRPNNPGHENAGQEEEIKDPHAYLAQYDYLEVLKPGEYDKDIPCRCRLCKTRKEPLGKVFELSRMTYSSVKHFVSQHLNGAKHLQLVARYRQQQAASDQPDGQIPLAKCEALMVNDPESGKLSEYRKEFAIWASMANVKKLARHCYWHDANNDTWFVRSVTCLQDTEPVPGRRTVCKECIKICSTQGVPRTVAKFALKYFAAKLLSTRRENCNTTVFTS